MKQSRLSETENVTITDSSHSTPLLAVRNLSVVYPTVHGQVQALQNIHFDLYPGRTLVVLGESGCGKSTLGRALLGLLPPPGTIKEGAIAFTTHRSLNLTDLSEPAWRTLRGKEISLILQDPVQALNPVLTIGFQMVEVLQAHKSLSYNEARETSLHLLKLMELKDPERVFRAYPFQLSGGMCQRVAIAIALANNPKVLVADEPTTALDVRVQAAIIALVKKLQQELGISLLLITHDVGVAADMADDIAVMYAGRIVEIGDASQILYESAHPYTRALFECFPHDQGTIANALPGQPPGLIHLPDQCAFLPRCRLRDDTCQRSPFPPFTSFSGKNAGVHTFSCYHPLNRNPSSPWLSQSQEHLISSASFATDDTDQVPEKLQPLLQVEQVSKTFYQRRLLKKHHAPFVALDNVSVTVEKGEVLGIVGESGCGKTTLARCILRLEHADSGKICLQGENLCALRDRDLRRMRQHMQPVFQSPRGSLNSGRTALELVQDPLQYFQVGSPAERRERARWLLDMVGLVSELVHRKPNYLSTGQCQRVAIARALALEPELLICDEPVSSLDLSVQAQILSLLAELHAKLRFGMLFISHNILVVQSISNRIVVMESGKVCEILPAGRTRQSARHPYTRALFDAVPRLVQ